MPDTVKLPPARTYNVTVVSPEDGHQDRLGRWYVGFDGTTAQRLPRRNPSGAAPLDTLEVVSAETVNRKETVLTGVDGTVWRLKGCGCGGG